MSFDNVIFDDKTLSDMFKDVYDNTKRKRQQIEEFIKNYIQLISTPEDAAVLGPVLKDFMDINVKNDEHIVRLVQIAQRLVTINTKSGETDLLTEEEKQQLLKNIKLEFESVVAEKEDLQDSIDGISK